LQLSQVVDGGTDSVTCIYPAGTTNAGVARSMFIGRSGSGGLALSLQNTAAVSRSGFDVSAQMWIPVLRPDGGTVTGVEFQ
jgi:hypothetical protein